MKRRLSRSAATAGSTKKRRLSVARTASAALTLARRIQRNVETKAVGVSNSATVTTTPTVVHVSQIAQGDDNSNRSGDHVNATRFRFRGTLVNNTASTFQPVVRILVVQNLRQQPDTNADMGQQFTATTIYGFNLATLGFKNLLVYYDKTFTVPISNETAATPTYQNGRRFIEFDMSFKYPFKISYNGAATTDIDRNGVYVILVGDLSSNAPTATWEALLNFQDP